VSKLAFIDEKINSMYVLRNDMPTGILNFTQLYYQQKLDNAQLMSQYMDGIKSLVNIFEVYKTPIVHYQRSYDRVCRFIKRELTQRIIESDESHLKYEIFNQISVKGVSLFKNVHSKLDQAFGKLDLDENLRNETEKIRGKLRTQLDL
jgi:hypothetical protein